MANREEGYGFTAEIGQKIQGKYDIDLEQEVLQWIQSYVSDAGLNGVSGADNVHEKLKDGVILCKLINALQPGSVKKINTSKMAFKQMENIGLFLEGIQAYGVQKSDTFQTVDLYEATNMAQVILSIYALGRKAGTKGAHGIGPKEAQENKREFTEQQLREGKNHIGLQMGTNKFASQSGQNFGKTRAILD